LTSIKQKISFIILCSLFLSLIAGVIPASAVESPEELLPEELYIDIETSDIDEEVSFELHAPDAIDRFVDRLYRLVLNRPPEPAGFQEWTRVLRDGSATGTHIAHGFFFSQEMGIRNLPNDQFVETLYLTMLDRPSEPAGKTEWVRRLNEGYLREYVFAGFANSIEFGRLCEAAGINKGSYTPPPGSAIRAFVTRLYRLVLDREPEMSGLTGWTDALLTGSTGAHVAHGFVFSREMGLRNLPNDRFVEILYLTLLDRAPGNDPGRAVWVQRLDEGYTREYVFAGFVNSIEFGRLCRDAGIVQGSYSPPEGWMVRVFTTHMFKSFLNRSPNPVELDFWFDALRNGSATGASLAYELMFRAEFIAGAGNSTNDAFVESLFKAMTGRNASAAERNFWTTELRNGFSRYSIFVRLTEMPEFENLCIAHGVTRGEAPQPSNSMIGDTMMTRTWNLIVATQFPGISDRPEHIAGIVGNLQSEAGPALCPFQIQVSNHRGLGLMQWTDPTASGGRRTELEKYMWQSGISQEEFYTEMNKHLTWYCGNPQHLHPPELLDRVLEVQINFMFHEFRTTSERLYLNYIDFPDSRTGIAGARAYAELFCSLALRPGPGASDINDIQDEGVIRALQASPFVGGAGRLDRISYSALGVRRNRAEAVYIQYLANHR
jgi:hypothetical protein